LHIFRQHKRWVHTLAFCPDGKRIAFADEEAAKVWNVATGEVVFFRDHQKSRISSVAFSPRGEEVASADGSGKVMLWSATTGQVAVPLPRPAGAGGVHCVAFSPDGQRLAVACAKQSVEVWDLQTRQQVLTFEGHEAPVRAVVFSPDGQQIASASDA